MQRFNKTIIFLLLLWYPLFLQAVNVSIAPLGSYETTEGGSNINIAVGLDSSPNADVTIYCATSDPTEAKCSPTSKVYTQASYIADSTHTESFTIQPVNDVQVDGNINYTVTFSVGQVLASDSDEIISDPSSSQTLNFTNIDNDVFNSQRVILTNTSLSVSENITTDSFSIMLDKKPTDNVTISPTSSDTTEGTILTKNVVFTPKNWDTPQKVFIQGVDDAVQDGDITFQIDLGTISSTDSYYNGYTTDTFSATNTDNDGTSSPYIIIETPNGTTTGEDGISISINLSLSEAPALDITVKFGGQGGMVDTTEFDWGAVFNHYESLTFTNTNWNTPQTITLTGVDDSDYDGNITGYFTATDDSSTYEATTIMITNQDNEPTAPNMTVNVSDYSTSEDGDSATISVVLNQVPSSALTLDFASMKPHQGSVSSSSLTFDNTNWNIAQSITVNAVNNSTLDFTSNYEIRISSTSMESAFLLPVAETNPSSSRYLSYTFYTKDNESVATINFEDINTTGSEYTASFSVVLDHEINGTEVRVYPTLNNSSEMEFLSPTAQYLLFTEDNWNTPQQIIVQGKNDTTNLQIENHSVKIKLQTRNDSDYNTDTIYHTLNLGDYSPNSFNFTDISNQNPNAQVTSSTITLSGLNSETNVSISGTNCSYKIDNETFIDSNSSIADGQTITLQTTAPSNIGESVTCKIHIGAFLDEWKITNILKIDLSNLDLDLKNITKIYLVDSTNFNGTIDGSNSIEISNAASSLQNGVTNFDLTSSFDSYLLVFITNDAGSTQTQWIYNKNTKKLYSLDNYTTSTQTNYELNSSSSSDINLSINLSNISWINTSKFEQQTPTNTYYIPNLEFSVTTNNYNSVTSSNIDNSSFYQLSSYDDKTNARYNELKKLIIKDSKILDATIKLNSNNIIESISSTNLTSLRELKPKQEIDSSELDSLYSQYTRNLNFSIGFPSDAKGYEVYSKQITDQCYLIGDNYFNDFNYTTLTNLTNSNDIIEYNHYNPNKGLKFANNNANNIYELNYETLDQVDVGTWTELTNIQCKTSNESDFTSSSVVTINLTNGIEGYNNIALIKDQNGKYVKGVYIAKDTTKKHYTLNQKALEYFSTNLGISHPLKYNYTLIYDWTYLSLPTNTTLCTKNYQSSLSSICNQSFSIEDIFGTESSTKPITMFKYRGGYWSNYSTENDKTYNMDKISSINHTDGLLIHSEYEKTLELPYDIFALDLDRFQLYNIIGWHLVGNQIKTTPSELENNVTKQGSTLKYIMTQSPYNETNSSSSWKVSAPSNNNDVNSSLDRIDSLSPIEAMWIYVE